jgi:hypothetical protein
LYICNVFHQQTNNMHTILVAPAPAVALVTAPTAEQAALVLQMVSSLKDFGFLMFDAINAGLPIGIEQSVIFSQCRDLLAQRWSIPQLQAANFCRLALNEAVFATTGKFHYSEEELEIIISKAF